jgi:RimJ/RimL family protein N-acetyltransferase
VKVKRTGATRKPQVILRAVEEQDIPLLHALRNDVSLQQLLLALPRPNSVVRVRAWLAAIAADERRVLFVIGSGRAGKAVGYAQLNQIESVHGTAEVGICLAPSAQGKGYGRAAMELLATYARDVLNLRKLCLCVRATNQPAVALYRRLKYTEVGCWRAHRYQAGAYHDVLLMERFLVSPGP